MQFWTAFILGLVGSLHCAGMCGPLALALPMSGGKGSSWLVSRGIYNFSRVISYAALGGLFGLVGTTMAFAGWQRWISIVAGSAILIGLAASSKYAVGKPMMQSITWLKSGFARLLRKKTLASLAAMGLLNGLLPCGLVYVACAGAAATGGPIGGVEYMLAFGIGTLPMMLGIAFAGKTLQLARFKLQRLIPVTVALAGVLLIVRGLSLGIPYLSPDCADGHAKCPACSRPMLSAQAILPK